MLAQPGGLPVAGGWAYEVKWDGVRALAYVEDGTLRLVSRNANDITIAYPELGSMAEATGGHDVVLDGEIVAFDAQGRPSFEALQPRMHQRRPVRVRELARSVPVTYLAFDVLHVNTAAATSLPYTERRGILERLLSRSPRWDVPPAWRQDGESVFAESVRLGLEGVVAKRLTSPYRPGRRSADWIKVKGFRDQDVVIVGWKPGRGRRTGTIGSLLLGVVDEGRLVYAGHVGTGFGEAALRALAELLRPLERPSSPLDTEVPREHATGARWVEPLLVGEVRFSGWTSAGQLRHPSWRGLREGKGPADAVRA
jgi:bifunctional non-homologous end joining protein LigD